jgi:hypothetical protein
MTCEDIVETLQEHIRTVGRRNNLLDETVRVSARALSPEEAIGNPEHDDYPLIVGRERMMEANVRGGRGQAFTDMYGRWEGPLREIREMRMENNFRRAILVATLNAVMRFAGEITDTVHCKDAGPVECAEELASFVASKGLKAPFALIGYQPRFAETLAEAGELRIVDMDIQHIGRMRAGVKVHAPEETDEALAGAGCVFVTGTTLVNGTIQRFMGLPVPTIFYGVTISGAAQLLGLRRFCPTSL